VLEAWLVYLRQSHPAIPFKCNTQSQRGNLGSSVGKISKQSDDVLHTSHAVGSEELLNLLKNYCRVGEGAKSIITVGIVGFPNVGKSSLINSLTRARSVGVSPTPGYTKVAQEVILDKNIRLIDSPGIVFADGQTASTALRNCVHVESMEDVLTPVQAIVEKCPAPYLMQVYGISQFPRGDAMAFLALVARAMGKLKKGGVPNVDSAARIVLHDWNHGKIKYYCKPPTSTNKGKKATVESNGVDEKETVVMPYYSKELDLQSLTNADMRVMTTLYPAATGGSNGGSALTGTKGKTPAVVSGGLDGFYVGMDELAAPVTEDMEE
jgi:nuclear GTP-binding protein